MKAEEAKNEMETPHINETPAETMQESVAEPAETNQETVAQEPDPTSVTEPIDVKEDQESKLQAEPEPQKGKETPVSATRKAVFSQLEQLDEMPIVPPSEEPEEKKEESFSLPEFIFDVFDSAKIAILIVLKIIKTEITKNTIAKIIPPVRAILAQEVIVFISILFTS